jgi:competence protein ComEC
MGLLVYFPIRALLALIPWIALRYPIKKWAAAGAILSTLAYTLLVGSQAATLRSMMMTGIAMLAILLDRRAAPLRLVMLSAAIVMLIAPDAMLGPSFQMSFAAVFCLIAAHERRFEFLFAPDAAIVPAGPVRWIIGHFGLIMMTSLIATAATTPFAIYHFQTFSFYGFIANMLAIPLTSFWVMPCILMAYLTAPFGLDGWFIDGAGAGIALTIKIALTVASWPFSIFYLPAMPAFVLVMIVLGGLWLCLWQKRWRYLGLIPILIGAFYPFYTPKPDIMIAPDASEWAARLDDGTLAVSNLDRATFITSQWQQRLGNVPVVDVTALPPSETQLRCDEAGCVYRHGTYSVALPELPAAVREDCAHAAVVIAPVVIHDCAAPVVIDEPLFWRHGAMTLIFAGDTVHIAHARARRGERPWSPGWKNHADED